MVYNEKGYALMVILEHPDNENITILAAVTDIPAPLGEAEFVFFKKNHVPTHVANTSYMNILIS